MTKSNSDSLASDSAITGEPRSELSKRRGYSSAVTAKQPAPKSKVATIVWALLYLSWTAYLIYVVLQIS